MSGVLGLETSVKRSGFPTQDLDHGGVRRRCEKADKAFPHRQRFGRRVAVRRRLDDDVCRHRDLVVHVGLERVRRDLRSVDPDHPPPALPLGGEVADSQRDGLVTALVNGLPVARANARERGGRTGNGDGRRIGQ